jgi:hypothetical protein
MFSDYLRWNFRLAALESKSGMTVLYCSWCFANIYTVVWQTGIYGFHSLLSTLFWNNYKMTLYHRFRGFREDFTDWMFSDYLRWNFRLAALEFKSGKLFYTAVGVSLIFSRLFSARLEFTDFIPCSPLSALFQPKLKLKEKKNG